MQACKKWIRRQNLIYHIVIIFIAWIMVYPLLWMFFSSFKENSTIFTTAAQLLPDEFTLQNYINGWKGFGKVSFGTFFKNSLFVCVVGTIGSCISSYFVAFGMARLQVPGKKIIFGIILVSMMLPAQVLMIPQYLWYQKLNWVNTYLPLTVPYFFATTGFFIYLLINFISGLPKELDEAARIDGCSDFAICTRIILPLSVPAVVTVAIFSFMWKWDDYLTPLLYLQKSENYTVSLALKMFCDPSSQSDYGAMFAMAILSLIPVMLLFFIFQKYITDGISTSGLKG